MPSSGRKKNKPMTAKEQESKIAHLRQQLRRMDGDSSTNDGQYLVESWTCLTSTANEDGDSGDEASSSSSEEE
jgi:hypothetical protein